MPMRLDEGWNQIQFNLSDFTRRAYGTNYIETLRVQIHANCRIRRIYFADRLYTEEELPPEFKLFLPIDVSPLFWYLASHSHPILCLLPAPPDPATRWRRWRCCPRGDPVKKIDAFSDSSTPRL